MSNEKDYCPRCQYRISITGLCGCIQHRIVDIKPGNLIGISNEKTEGIKFDQDKAAWELLPFDALAEITQVLSFGAKKYEPRNWEKGFNWMRIVGSALRHLAAWIGGEDLDKETGLSHLAHFVCNGLFLLTFSIRRIGTDDRPCVK